jgi:hypothetical protein
MRQGKPRFLRLMANLPRGTCSRYVSTHRGKYKVKDFTGLDQFFAMARPLCAKAAIRLHTLLDRHDSIPSFNHIIDGNVHQIDILGKLVIESSAFCLLDHGNLDFSGFLSIHLARAQSKTQLRRRYSNSMQRGTASVVCDQIGVQTLIQSGNAYPQALCGVWVMNKSGKRITFLTNNFALKPELIAELYRQR